MDAGQLSKDLSLLCRVYHPRVTSNSPLKANQSELPAWICSHDLGHIHHTVSFLGISTYEIDHILACPFATLGSKSAE
jgi:hypothetical protein